MAYSVPDDVRNALAPGVWPVPEGDTAPTTHTAADMSNSQLVDEIAEADSLIDGYIGRYYQTPVAAVENVTPSPIDKWSRNIAAYTATLTYRKGKDLSQQDPVALRYAMTLQQLVAVRDGKATLPLPVNGGDSGVASAGAPFNPYTGTMFDETDFSLGPVEAGDWRGHWVPLI